MHQNELTPFPTLVEIIRTIANAFNSKQSNKSLDEKVYDSNVDYRQIEKFLVDSIGAPLQKIDQDLSQITVENIRHVIKQYVNMVQSISLDFVSRADSLPLLLELWFPQFAENFLNDIHQKKGGPKPNELAAGNVLAVSAVIDWIAEHETEWKKFVKSCVKDEIDLIDSWKRGRQLPSLQRVSSLGRWSNTLNPKSLDWNRVKTLLIVARAIDQFRKTELGMRAVNEVKNLCWSVVPERNLFDELEKIQLQNSRIFEGIDLPLREIQNTISRARDGEEINHGELKKELRRVKKLLKHSETREGMSYHLIFMKRDGRRLEAIWTVHASTIEKHLKEACSEEA